MKNKPKNNSDVAIYVVFTTSDHCVIIISDIMLLLFKS